MSVVQQTVALPELLLSPSQTNYAPSDVEKNFPAISRPSDQRKTTRSRLARLRGLVPFSRASLSVGTATAIASLEAKVNAKISIYATCTTQEARLKIGSRETGLYEDEVSARIAQHGLNEAVKSKSLGFLLF